MQLWEIEPPENWHKKSSQGAKVTVWVAMSNHCLINPILFNETVNSEQYMCTHMLQNNYLLQPMAKGLHLLTRWLMEDGSWPHTANIMLDIFNTVFGPRIMSNSYPHHHNWQIWPPLRPDLNPCDFLPCSFLKEKMLKWKSSNETEMTTMFVELCRRTNEDISQCYYKPVRRLQECTQRNGSQLCTRVGEHTHTNAWAICRKVVEERQTIQFL
jgi:hypothetical protein